MPAGGQFTYTFKEAGLTFQGLAARAQGRADVVSHFDMSSLPSTVHNHQR